MADSFDEDPRRPEVIEALEDLCARLARGRLRLAAWRQAGAAVRKARGGMNWRTPRPS